MKLRSPLDAPPDALPVREAYGLWATRYDDESAVSVLENRTVGALTPSLKGRSLLDAGCGTGRRLPSGPDGPLRAVGVDLVPEMLGAARHRSGAALAAGDIRALPLARGAFDVVWCRMALGHLPELTSAYGELARVTRLGGRLVVSDFHPEAVVAGHARTFRDAQGRPHAVEHHMHSMAEYERAARAVGWTIDRTSEVAAGPEEKPFYERTGRLEQYERERGLPLVLAMRCTR